MTTDYATLDATSVVAGLKSGEIAPEAYAEAIADRAHKQKELNALQAFDPDTLAAQSKAALANHPGGALAGLPIVAKDNINTRQFPTSGGTRAMLNHVPATDAGVVKDIVAAGGFVGAKAGMHELAFGITSNNAVSGAVRNPVAPEMIPGGSSGGTASAIAAGIFPAGLGTDTGGSCRIPAALCGIVGFRPTTGRYSTDGVIPISKTRDTPGPLARNVRDIALFDRVLSGDNTPLMGIDLSAVTLGVPKEVFFDNLDPHVAEAMDAQLKVLSGAGVRLIEVSLDPVLTHNGSFGMPVVLYEVMRELPGYLAKHAPGISFEALIDGIGSPDVAGALNSQLGEGRISKAAYREAIDLHGPAMRQMYGRLFEDHRLDAIVFPTTPLPARPIGEDETVELNGEDVSTFRTYVRNTDPGSNLGAPGISLPCPVASGLPVGIEFDGLPGADILILAMAAAVEKVMAKST